MWTFFDKVRRKRCFSDTQHAVHSRVAAPELLRRHVHLLDTMLQTTFKRNPRSHRVAHTGVEFKLNVLLIDKTCTVRVRHARALVPVRPGGFRLAVLHGRQEHRGRIRGRCYPPGSYARTPCSRRSSTRCARRHRLWMDICKIKAGFTNLSALVICIHSSVECGVQAFKFNTGVARHNR